MKTPFAVFAMSLSLSACGPSEPTCEECRASMQAPEGCHPYCEPQDGPDPREWAGMATATVVFAARDPNAEQPRPIQMDVSFRSSSVSITDLCHQPIPLTNGRFRSATGISCWVGATLPGFFASDAPDQWASCDGAEVILYSLDLERRDGGTRLYGEGGAMIRGCNRTWESVLFQVHASH